VSSCRRYGKPFRPVHQFITNLRTSPKALLLLVRQCWAIENEWHWARDLRLSEDAHRYNERNGVQVLALHRTQALNLLRSNGFGSIREGAIAVSHDITGLLGWTGAYERQTA